MADAERDAGTVRARPAKARRLDASVRRVRLMDFYGHRHVISVIAGRDLRARYAQSVLGPAWLIIQPLGLLVGLLVGFAAVLDVDTNGVPYPLFALCGLTAWSYFSAALGAGSNSLILNAALVQRTPAPRVAFPTAALISTLPSLLVTLAAAVVWSAASGLLNLQVLLLPLVIVWLLMLTSGAVLTFSSVAVFARDVASATPFVLQVGVFLAPIGYPLSNGSGLVAWLLKLNPVTGIIELFRYALIKGYELDTRALLVSAATGLCVVILGWQVFSRAEPLMGDVI